MGVGVLPAAAGHLDDRAPVGGVRREVRELLRGGEPLRQARQPAGEAPRGVEPLPQGAPAEAAAHPGQLPQGHRPAGAPLPLRPRHGPGATPRWRASGTTAQGPSNQTSATTAVPSALPLRKEGKGKGKKKNRRRASSGSKMSGIVRHDQLLLSAQSIKIFCFSTFMMKTNCQLQRKIEFNA